MTPFALQLARAAVKDLDHISLDDRRRVIEDLHGLERSPIDRPPRIKRLRGFSPPLYRLRSGDFRVLYRIDRDLITVMRIINRRDLDRILRQLRLAPP